VTAPLTTTGPPTRPGPVTGPADTGRAPASTTPRSRLSAGLATTPGRLALATTVAVVACLLLGVTGFLAGNTQSAALRDAQRDAAQLVGTQELRNDLVSADATATNAFLVGGLEPAEARARYEASLTEAAEALPTLASTARDTEAADLATVSDSVQRYSGLVESARANNRQGFPVGAAYLDQASAALRGEVLPTLDEVALSTSERVDDDLTSVSLAQALLLFVLLGLVALAAVQLWLARRTHRVLNTGLAAASVALLVGGIVAIAAVLGGNGVARSVASGPYAATVATSQALALATDAKSMESFTLIKRGSGADFEESYQTSLAQARTLLTEAEDATETGIDGSRELLDAWDVKHTEIRELDDGGDWEAAVKAATSTAEGSAGAAFTAFSDHAHADVEATSTDAVDRLGSAATTAQIAAWVALVLGVAGAVAAAAGMNVRLKEYR
jgi:ribosomal protein S11